MAAQAQIQYVSDEKGKAISVIVPIQLWQEIISERETAYLLKSDAMRKRLLEAKNRKEGVSFEDACIQLGI
ncbi:MAG: prevent-host-death protein [Desulfamplus sp.]|nr:prevent-host-death protein [Desulfamplus sp.]